MYKVGIVGAGVGGSYLAYLLSKAGLDTVVFDFRAPHEKLCGGGVTYKAIAKFPVLNELPCPRKEVWKSIIVSPKERELTIDFEKPLTIFNRRDLDCSLLKMAQEHGAQFRKERVRSFSAEGDRWRILTEKGAYRTEILVGADGALSGTRKTLGLPPKKEDYFLALECFLDIQRDFITFKFFPDSEGYLWAFPRTKVLGVGIVCRHCDTKDHHDVKAKLLHYIERNYPVQAEGISLRGAYIPFFSAKDIQGPGICSKNWALIGDAASFVDPISGEGISYALFSADILAKCIIENRLSSYQGLCMEHFGENLLEASQDFEYFYRTEFIETMIALAERSKPLQSILSEMVAGDINYLTWKTRFRKSFLRLLGDFIFNFEAATRKEVITNLVRWYSQRPTSHPRHNIS